jgi:polyhydroxyalkanoate synthesis regulator protein
VLTQIIVEEEGKGENLLPTNFLRQLIGFYGGAMSGVVPGYLEQAMKTFTQQQEQVQAAMRKAVGSIPAIFPFGNVEEMGRQNMAMMERAFSMFTPFKSGAEGEGQPADPVKENAALRMEIDRLRRELAKDGKKS